MGLLLVILIFATTIYYMSGGQVPYIRRVPGLDAIDEAVARATEMGRPVICSYGQSFRMFDYWTVAALNILSYVSEQTAELGPDLYVPSGGSSGSYIVRPVAAEIVKTSYQSQGRLDEFDEEEMIPFFSGTQFAYGAGYVGMLLSERPAATIYVGPAGADAMMTAEVSRQVGAITITSASYIANVACMACASDYILIGEELPAAGAYLSQEPAELASIRTQDIMKFLAIGFIILGVLLVQIGNEFLVNLLQT